jgi:hypothetical protein
MLFDVCMSEPCATIPIASKQRARYGKKYKQIYAGGMGVKFNPVSVWMSHSYGANIEVTPLNAKQSDSKQSFKFSIYDQENANRAFFTRMAWSKCGTTLYAGSTDGSVYTYKFPSNITDDN